MLSMCSSTEIKQAIGMFLIMRNAVSVQTVMPKLGKGVSGFSLLTWHINIYGYDSITSSDNAV